ncbi:MAG: PEP-CTERM sorting domain-containing protein, partial [Sedimentisphaerales bacterium]|nr:PEP-CTERM sorting domain-containing protein [Sedimentisphaerales bacterium]
FVIGIEDGNRPSDFDYYSVCSRYNVSNNDVPMDSIVWQLADYSGQALSSIYLPTTAPVIDDWQDFNLLTLSGGGNPQEGEYGFCIIASVKSAALIPEPATLMLLSLGCLRLGIKRRPVSDRCRVT